MQDVGMWRIGDPPIFQPAPLPSSLFDAMLPQLHHGHALAFMLEHSADVIVMFDDQWRMVYANLQWEKNTGLSRDATMGITLWEYAPTLVGTDIEKTYKACMLQKRMCSFTCLHPITKKYVITSVYPGENTFCLQLRDVTDFKILDDSRVQKALEIQRWNEELELRVEQRTHDLKKAQEFNARVIKDSIDGIVGLDTKLEIFAWNPTMEKLTGILRENIIGKSVMTLFPIAKHQEISSVLQRVLSGETIISTGESNLVKEPKQGFDSLGGADYERYLSPMIGDVDGTVVGAIINYKNIATQNEIKQALTKARDEALSLAKVKSEFLANMSHELRTPLNAIIGLTDLMKETNLDTHQREYFDIIQGSAVSLLAIVNHVLDFSKYEVGKMPYVEEEFSLLDVVNNSAVVFCREAENKGLDFSWHFMDDLDLCTIYGDPMRLRQVLVNLVNNAIKFTAKGFVRVILSKISSPSNSSLSSSSSSSPSSSPILCHESPVLLSLDREREEDEKERKREAREVKEKEKEGRGKQKEEEEREKKKEEGEKKREKTKNELEEELERERERIQEQDAQSERDKNKEREGKKEARGESEDKESEKEKEREREEKEREEREEREDDLVWVDITVEDSGVGMNQNTLKALFTPFTQADASTTRVYGGTGLGLAIVKQIVEFVGGGVSVTSKEDVGTSFHIRVPFRVVSIAPKKAPEDEPYKKKRERRNTIGCDTTGFESQFPFRSPSSFSDLPMVLEEEEEEEVGESDLQLLSNLQQNPNLQSSQLLCNPNEIRGEISQKRKSKSANSTPGLHSIGGPFTNSNPVIVPDMLQLEPPAEFTVNLGSSSSSLEFENSILRAKSDTFISNLHSNSNSNPNSNSNINLMNSSSSPNLRNGGHISVSGHFSDPFLRNRHQQANYNHQNWVGRKRSKSGTFERRLPGSTSLSSVSSPSLTDSPLSSSRSTLSLSTSSFSLAHPGISSLSASSSAVPSATRRRSLERMASCGPSERCHVLVVEDNEVNKKVLTLLLKRLKVTVETCSNGVEALSTLSSNPLLYDLVLMDVQMPIMDGYTAAEEIRKISSLSHIPIIAMTANAMPGDKERCLDSGMDDYIAKPINMKILAPILETWGKKNFENNKI